MISVLSLVVAILAVFFGPLIARANVQRQIRANAREAWRREFREQVAKFMASRIAIRLFAMEHPQVVLDEKTGLEHVADPVTRRLNEIRDVGFLSDQTVRLLIAERGDQYSAFISKLELVASGKPAVTEDKSAEQELIAAAGEILRREQASIDQSRPWFAEGAWRSRERLKVWATGRPRFPTYHNVR